MEKVHWVHRGLHIPRAPNLFRCAQCQIHDFHLGGVSNDQVNKSNNKIEIFKVLFKEFLECRGCGRTHIATLRSTPGCAENQKKIKKEL